MVSYCRYKGCQILFILKLISNSVGIKSTIKVNNTFRPVATVINEQFKELCRVQAESNYSEYSSQNRIKYKFESMTYEIRIKLSYRNICINTESVQQPARHELTMKFIILTKFPYQVFYFSLYYYSSRKLFRTDIYRFGEIRNTKRTE